MQMLPSTQVIHQRLPMDVYRTIMSFGSVQIRTRFNAVMQEIARETILRTALLRAIAYRDPVMNDDYVFDHETVFNYVKKCRCCSRHMLRRPMSYDEDYVEYPFTLKLGDQSCDCVCRHVLRNLLYCKRT